MQQPFARQSTYFDQSLPLAQSRWFRIWSSSIAMRSRRACWPHQECWYGKCSVCLEKLVSFLADATDSMLVALQLCCLCVLILIFRLLQSTAEDFFSPVLTQISQEMGLPPRFAGGTRPPARSY